MTMAPTSRRSSSSGARTAPIPTDLARSSRGRALTLPIKTTFEPLSSTTTTSILGVELPAAWVAKSEPSEKRLTVWDVAGDPDPVENGRKHCIVAYGYNAQGVLIDTWGMFGTITWAALAKYCSGESGELYTIVAA